MNCGKGFAGIMVAYADATMLLPDGLDYEQAAPLFCAGYTVWSGLRWAEPQLRTIAISRSPDKDKLIRQLGADEIVRAGHRNTPTASGKRSSYLADALNRNGADKERDHR
jgi:D-arabinose 1-dehydrogenase-like Zn-dependent alcohol dehydrogenase